MQKIDRILDYAIHRTVGKGSFSQVYEGRCGGKIVAIKLMKPPVKINADELWNSLRYEFWILKDLVHPNIVRLFDFGQLPDGRLYLIEEFIAGAPLNVFCQRRPFAECETVFVDLLKALDALERRGLVHGDVKPANILVKEGSQGAIAKILDFGIARPDRSSLPRSSYDPIEPRLVQKNPTPLRGTPSTMAPEVILRRPSDHRCDLYSLGVCFYASLAGSNPFIGNDIEETLQAHLTKKAEPVGLARRDIPPEWGDLIHRLIEKNPDDRPASALKALSLVRKDTFVLSPSPFVGREGLLSSAMDIGKDLVLGKRKALTVNGKEGIGVTRFLREVFYRLISSRPDLRRRIALVENLPYPDKPILLLDRLPPPSGCPSITLTLKALSMEEVSQWLGLVLNLKKVPQKVLEKVFSLSGGHPQSVWDLLSLLAEKRLLADASGLVTPSMLSLIDWEEILPGQEISGEVGEDIDWVMASVRRRIATRTLTEDDPIWNKLEKLASKEKEAAKRLIQRARTLTLKGEAAIDEGKFERAREALTSALEIFCVSAGYKVDEVRTRNFLAYILLRQGRAEEAVKEFELSLADVRKGFTAAEVRQITNLDLGFAYLQVGKFREAIYRLKEEQEFHRSLQSDPAQSKAALIHEIGCLYNLAQSHSALREVDLAEKYYREVIAKARQCQEAAFILRGLNGLGNVLKNTERWKEGLDAYGEALELALALRDFSSAAAAAQNRGSLAASHGLNQEALSDLAESLKYANKIGTPYAFEKTLICRSHVELGEILIALNRLVEAQDHLDRAWHLAEKDQDLSDFRFWVLLARCRLWKAQGEVERFKQELARLNFYADTDEKQRQLEELGVTSKVQPIPSHQVAGVATVSVDESRVAELEALLKITGDLLEDLSLNELLKRILRHAIQLGEAELGAIVLVDEKGELTPTLSLNADLNEELCDISLSVAREVVSTGRILQATDASHEGRFAHSASVMALHLRSIIGLPMIYRGKVLGVLYLSHRHRIGLFDRRNTKILAAFADQAALAFTHHHLLDFHRRAREKAELSLDETRQELTLVREKILSLPENLHKKFIEGPLKTSSRVLLETLNQVERVAATRLSIVIHGETGTGKELMARYVHEVSDRKVAPFIAINCGALPANLIEDTLFGHVKGAFTGADHDQMGLIEAAQGGSLFLDEITDLPMEAQVKLLRVLQEREVVRLGETKPRPVDIRLIAASQKSLRDGVSNGTFREDLYYRLMGLEVFVPPLRERPEDVHLLSQFFLSEYLRENRKKQPSKITGSFLRLLTDYHWPGNIRELNNIITTAAALTEEKVLSAASLPKNLRDRLVGSKNPRAPTEGIQAGAVGWYRPGLTWREHELFIYASGLISLNFNVPQVAASLGVGVATIYKWMREYRIRETTEDWKKKILPYKEGTRLSEIRAMVFSQVAERFPGHPYHAARELDVAPVTYYRWSSVRRKLRSV